MKRSKRIIILAVILALLTAATLALNLYEGKQEQIRVSGQVIVQIPAAEVESVSWINYKDETFSFRKEAGQWIYEDDPSFPVDEEKIANVLTPFESYSASFIIEQVEDYGQYGLADPKLTLTINTPDRSFTLKQGGFSIMDSQSYIDIGDGNVYLVKESPEEYVETTLPGMLKHDDTPVLESASQITFSGAENYTISSKVENTNIENPEFSYYTTVGGKTLSLDSEKVETFLGNVTLLRLMEYITYNASEQDLKAYGLDKPVLTITVQNKESGECHIEIGEVVTEAETEGQAATVSRYVRIGDSRIVYILSDYDYEKISAVSVDTFRHPEVIQADVTAISRMEVLLEGQTHTFLYTPPAEESQAGSWSWNDTTIDISPVGQSLLALSADSFTQNTPKDKEEISLKLYTGEELTVTVQLYRYDGKTCLAVVDGQPVSLVPRASAMALVEAVQAIVLN